MMKILFICTHNRCRSILAEAIANDTGGPYIQAASAGSSPQGEVHPLSLHYLSEHGMSIEGLQSQSWDDYEDFNPDAVITLCDSAAKEQCPVWFGDSVQAHWGLSDPSQLSGTGEGEYDQDGAFNHTIDILQRRITCLVEALKTDSKCSLKSTLNQIATDIN